MSRDTNPHRTTVMTTTATTPAFKIMRDSEGNRAVKIGSRIIPADIAGLCTGKDAWIAQIECKCRECKRTFPLRQLQGGGQWCEECQAAAVEVVETGFGA